MKITISVTHAKVLIFAFLIYNNFGYWVRINNSFRINLSRFRRGKGDKNSLSNELDSLITIKKVLC